MARPGGLSLEIDSPPSPTADEQAGYRGYRQIRQRLSEESGLLRIGKHVYEGVTDEMWTDKLLDSGVSGVVNEVAIRGHSIAVKTMRMLDKEREMRMVMSDLETLRKCTDCEHIVDYYGYVLTVVRMVLPARFWMNGMV